MGKKAAAIHVPDVIVGIVLLVVIPVVTLVSLSDSPADRAEGQTQRGASISKQELDEELEELRRIKHDNVELFISRCNREENPRYREEELRWATATLVYSKKRYEWLLERVRVADPAARSRIPQLQNEITRIRQLLTSGLPSIKPPSYNPDEVILVPNPRKDSE